MNDFKSIEIPVVVTQLKDGYSVFVPDLSMKVYGYDYIDAMSSAILKASAVYFYNLERDLHFDLKTKFAEAEQMCTDGHSYATFIALHA